MSNTTHKDLILDQFTRQATPFSTAGTITDESALRMVIEAAAPRPTDKLLDVACGGGIVVCAFAPHVRHATGIDMTPAMLERAHHLVMEKGISNVTWDRGDVTALPYADGTFDIVVTRFSMHHFLDPLGVLREMVRVCAPGGRVVVVDMYASDDPEKAAEWNPLFADASLPAPSTSFYELRDEVRNLLARSFPNTGDDVKIIEMFAASAVDDRLGIPIRREGDRIEYAYRVAILASISHGGHEVSTENH
jgi:ubiquinone/menaquinone biosynthesis C-methylase UbiE